MQVAHRKAGEPGLRPRAAAGGALVANLAAGASGRTRERRDRRRVVVRLHLHQHVRDLGPRGVGRRVGEARRRPALDRAAFHHRGVVAVGDDAVLRRDALGVPDHLEHRQRLVLAVDRELGVEDLVPAMLAVGLREHHQLDIARVAAELRERRDEVVDFVGREREAEFGVRFLQRTTASAQHIDMRQRRRRLRVEQVPRRVALEGDALGHAVVQQRRNGRAFVGTERLRTTEQAALQHEVELGDPLDAVHLGAAVARDVACLARPRRHGAQARHHDDAFALRRACVGVAIGEQPLELVEVRALGRRVERDPVHVLRGHRGDARARRAQPPQQGLGAEGAQGIAALEELQDQGRGGHAVIAQGARRSQRQGF